MKRKVLFSLVAILVAMFLVGSMSIGAVAPFTKSGFNTDEFMVADGEDAAIYITHNDNFSIYKGSGTLADPYLISGDILTSFNDSLVHIQNTDAYVIITDCIMNGTGYYGIYLKNVNNLNITACDIYNRSAAILIDNCSRIFVSETNITNYAENDYGIRIDNSDDVSIRGCNIFSAVEGIQLWNSFRVEIVDNTFTGTGITFYGTCQVSTGIRIQNNFVNGKLLGYLYNAHDMVIDISSYGQALLVNSVNVTLHHGNISNVNSGVEFIFCQNSILAYSNVTGCERGVVLYESAYSRLYGNNLRYNLHGLVGYFATGSIIHENNLLNNTGYDIWMWYGCSSSVIYENNIDNARDDGAIEDSNLTWIAGRFVNSVSGWSLSNVSVTVERAGRTHIAYTNVNGLLKLPVPAFGTYDLTIERFRYITKMPSVTIDTAGIHLFEVKMYKDDLGPGTGYVLARFMDGVTPIVGVDVQVYSVLDGGYYYHSEYTSAVSPAGWVNITGLYYDDYVFVITHPDYERNIINQVIIANGWAGTYNNIQLTAHPTDAFIYGNITDETTGLPLEDANVTIYNEVRDTMTVFTDATGLYNLTDIPFGMYQVEVSLTDYDTEYGIFNIDMAGNQQSNPEDFELLSSDYVPLEPEGASVNNWDNEVKGNYWDDFGGVVLLADEESVYEIPGDNMDNPVDEYPLDEIVVIPLEPELTPIPEIWSDSLEIYESETSDDRIWVSSFGVARWKVRWADNRTEIIENLDMLIQISGVGVDELLLANYIDGWWAVSYNHTEPALLEFSVYSVSSYGMTEFVQLAKNVGIIWDRIVIISVTTNTNVTTDVTPTGSVDVDDSKLGIVLVILGSAGIFIVLILYIIKKKLI